MSVNMNWDYLWSLQLTWTAYITYLELKVTIWTYLWNILKVPPKPPTKGTFHKLQMPWILLSGLEFHTVALLESNMAIWRFTLRFFWVVWDPQIIQYFSFFMGKLMVLGCTNLENTHLFTDEWTWGVYPRLRPAGDKPVDHRWFQGFVYSTPTSHEISWSLHSPWIWWQFQGICIYTVHILHFNTSNHSSAHSEHFWDGLNSP